MFEYFDEKDTSNFASCDSLIVTSKTDCYEVLINGQEELAYYLTKKELWDIMTTKFPQVPTHQLFSNNYLEIPIMVTKKGIQKANIRPEPITNNITLADCGFY